MSAKDLFAEIEVWADSDPDGWSSKERIAALVGGVLALRPRLIVEIGVWSGRSFVPMAMALRHLRSEGRILGIDPWRRDASVRGMGGEDLEFWNRVDHDSIFEKFTRELARTGGAPWAEIARCRSDEFKIPENMVIDILHVDGNHGEEASVYDVMHFAPRVRPGGLFFMDDVDWATKASRMIPELGFSSLAAIDRGIMFQRTR